MEPLRESTAIADTATSATPYANAGRTESIPLKGRSTSSASFLSRCCQNCMGFADDDAGDGLKYIISTFFILSVAVTVALAAQIYHGDFQVVPHGSVATDSTECSIIGTNILKKKGNAVDAAVASTLCMGVVNPHITGLGGGGFMLVYDHRRSEVLESLDFREAAPASALVMPSAVNGPRTVAVPGFLSGLYAAHKAHGKLSWQEVVKPASDLAKSGFFVPSSLVAARSQLSPRSGFNAKLHDMVDTLEAGQILKLPSLAATLELVATEGPDAFYNGSIAKEILAAVQGGTLTAADLSTYQPVQREFLHEDFYGYNIIVPGAPSGGPLLLAALKSIRNLNLSSIVVDESTTQLLLRQAQAIQQNYPVFYAESGDPNFSSVSTSDVTPLSLPETVASHVAAVDLNDLYVSVVSGHNSLFGAQVLTDAGFLLNNALASFDPSSSAAIKPTLASLHEGGILFDHHTEATAVPHLDAPVALPLHSKEDGKDISGTQLSAQLSALLKRRKRFEMDPRTTVWGTSVANNGLVGGKRPISIATPVVAIERGQICGRRLVLGGSDAGVLSQVLSQLLVWDRNISSSIEYPRIQVSPSGSSLSLEQPYAVRLSPVKRQQLSDLGLHMQSSAVFSPSVNIVEKTGDVLSSHSDSRGEGEPSRF